MKQKLFENWEFNEYEFLPTQTTEVEIVESNGKKLKEGILGIVKGPSFFGDSYSRNGRFYPKELWENALKNPDFQRNLERGLVFGCIGHPENYSLDELLSSGAVAVRIKDVNINNNVGEVTYEILDTPAGRILNTILRSGSKPYVSTRGFGSFSNETKEWNGKKVPILNPKDYVLESIDFVLNPGFLQTNPELVESLETDIKKLQESNIECEDGVCKLKLDEDINSDKTSIKTSKLESLDKKELLSIIEELKKENNFLLEKDEDEIITSKEDGEDDDENTDDLEDRKIKKDKPFTHTNLFFAYLELLLQSLKYNVTYKDEYEKISMILDYDEIKEKDLKIIEDICNKIKEDEVSESIKDICEYIIKIIDINKNNVKESSDSLREGVVNYVYRYWELQKNIELITKERDIFKDSTNKMIEKYNNLNKQFSKEYSTLKEEYIKKINDLLKENKEFQEQLVETIDEVKFLKRQNEILENNNFELKQNINSLKESTKEVQYIEVENKEDNKEIDILKGEINSLKKEIRELKYENEELKNDVLIKESELKKLNNNEKAVIKKNEILESKITDLKNELYENKKSLKEVKSEKQIIENKETDLKNELRVLKEEYNSLKEELKETKESFNKTNFVNENLESKIKSKLEKDFSEKLNKLELQNKENFIKYIQEKYKVDKTTAEVICSKYECNEDLIGREINSIKDNLEKSNNFESFEIKEEKVENKKLNMLETLIN